MCIYFIYLFIKSEREPGEMAQWYLLQRIGFGSQHYIVAHNHLLLQFQKSDVLFLSPWTSTHTRYT